ncbi:hypothetical protein L208DRAFT_1325806, partial [Tricholoma matsutake]
GIGAQIVHSLARCGYGDRLVGAALAENQDVEGLQHFIKTWCEDLHSELASDSRGIIKCHYGMLAAQIPSSFPSPEALNLYVNPITLWSPGYIPPDSSAWRKPTIHKITLFSIHHLGWTTGKDLLKRFHANLWSSVCFHMFCMPTVLYNPASQHLATPDKQVMVTQVKNCRVSTGHEPVIASSNVKVSAVNFVRSWSGGTWTWTQMRK